MWKINSVIPRYAISSSCRRFPIIADPQGANHMWDQLNDIHLYPHSTIPSNSSIRRLQTSSIVAQYLSPWDSRYHWTIAIAPFDIIPFVSHKADPKSSPSIRLSINHKISEIAPWMMLTYPLQDSTAKVVFAHYDVVHKIAQIAKHSFPIRLGYWFCLHPWFLSPPFGSRAMHQQWAPGYQSQLFSNPSEPTIKCHPSLFSALPFSLLACCLRYSRNVELRSALKEISVNILFNLLVYSTPQISYQSWL